MMFQRPKFLATPRRISVHLARIDTDSGLESTTSSIHRAESYVARRFLQGLLAAKLGCSISAVQIIQEPHEKPRIASGELEFSMSHNNGWCAVALSPDCPVGVDLEPIRPFAGMTEVVADYFPIEAKNAFAASTVEERNNVFFRWWTCIEAAVKAHGSGLDDAPSCLDGVFIQSIEGLDHLALSVAALTRESCAINWHMELDEDKQVSIQWKNVSSIY